MRLQDELKSFELGRPNRPMKLAVAFSARSLSACGYVIAVRRWQRAGVVAVLRNRHSHVC